MINLEEARSEKLPSVLQLCPQCNLPARKMHFSSYCQFRFVLLSSSRSKSVGAADFCSLGSGKRILTSYSSSAVAGGLTDRVYVQGVTAT